MKTLTFQYELGNSQARICIHMLVTYIMILAQSLEFNCVRLREYIPLAT